MSRYILAIDQGTTSSRGIIYNEKFEEIASHQLEHKQYYPNESWVEHDALEIYKNVSLCCKEAIKQAEILPENFLSIGITNQRETIVAWNRITSKPIYNAIVWQDKRTSSECKVDSSNLGHEKNKSKTGLTIDPYFSASKIRWILQHIDGAKELANDGKLCIGNIDSWLVWKLTNGKSFITDVSNASRTNLFNIHTLEWDKELLEYYHIPETILPQVVDSIGNLAETEIFGHNIPIQAIAGDQQASLYGNGCIQQFSIKNTIGTGSFLLQNYGNTAPKSKEGLLTTIAWKDHSEIVYAIEGSIFNTGSAIRWLRDKMKLIKNYDEIDELCNSIPENEVVVVPAFSGIGTPHWDMNARGTILGMTLDTDYKKVIKATIDAIAFQTRDIIDTMNQEIEFISIDGGGSNSDYLLQKISDSIQIEVKRSRYIESTAVGIAMMAAKVNNIKFEELNHLISFTPKISKEKADQEYKIWKKAVSRSLNWIEN